MTTEDDIDLARMPYEIRRAVEANGFAIEFLTPPLSVRSEDEGLVVLDRFGAELAVVPRHRLLGFDPERLRPFVGRALETLNDEQAQQLLAAINDGRTTIVDAPDDDRVGVVVDGFKLAAVHRSLLVDDWPEGE